MKRQQQLNCNVSGPAQASQCFNTSRKLYS
uniref:Uncharacterized protein n=1 Tax=Arundo donax TaxID=35708 RepID=A0A0A9EFT7_ARUDO